MRALALTAVGSATAALFVVPAIVISAATAEPRVTAPQVQKALNAAEAASEKVNAAKADESALRSRITQVNSEISSIQSKYDTQRDALASSIVQQQLNQPLGPTISLLASKDPDTFLKGLSTIDALNTTRGDQLQAFTQVAAELKNRKTQLAQKQAELAKVTATATKEQRTLQTTYKRAKSQFDQLNAAEQAKVNRSEGVAASTPAAAKSTASAAAKSVDVSSAPSGAAAAALKFALSQVGKPYVFGATGPGAYDCSGLMLASFASAGVSLPRTAAAQLAATTPIPWSSLQPGDLVGYANGHHIGMYVGNGMVVHAPHPGTVVQVVPMAWGGGFSVARRVG